MNTLIPFNHIKLKSFIALYEDLGRRSCTSTLRTPLYATQSNSAKKISKERASLMRPLHEGKALATAGRTKDN